MKDVPNDGLPNMSRLSLLNAPTKTGIFGGMQRMIHATSDSLIESQAEFTFTAGERRPRDMYGGADMFFPAKSYDDAKGIQAVLTFGCYYRPGGHLLDAVKRTTVTRSIQALAPIAMDIFLNPIPTLKTQKGWGELALQVRNEMAAKIPGDVLVTYLDANPGDIEAKITVRVYKVFDATFNIDRSGDGSLAYTFPTEFAKYQVAVYDLMRKCPRQLATVIKQGNKMRMTFDQHVEELRTENGRRLASLNQPDELLEIDTYEAQQYMQNDPTDPTDPNEPMETEQSGSPQKNLGGR